MNASHFSRAPLRSSFEVTAERLKPAGNDEEFALHRAALEWSLADPIVIHSIEDVKSRSEWREGFAPFEHQVQNLITFCRCLPVTLLADDVGLGKTISDVLAAAHEFAKAGQAAGEFESDIDMPQVIVSLVGIHFMPFAIAEVVEGFTGTSPFKPAFIQERKIAVRAHMRDVVLAKKKT